MVCYYSLFTHCSFDSNKSKHNFYTDEDSMRKFLADLKRHATEIIKFEKKEMLPLADKQKKKYNKQKLCHICKQEFNEEFHEDRISRRNSCGVT